MREPGYWIIDGVVSVEICDQLIARLESSLKRERAGARNLMSEESVRALANAEHLKQIAAEITGIAMLPFKATLFAKTGYANWLVAFHQDTALPVTERVSAVGWGPHSVKGGVIFAHAPTSALSNILALRIQLDASTDDNGPLRVIPGSHHRRIDDEQEFADTIGDGKEMTCLVEKGGVIAMSPLIIHASSKCTSRSPRRVLHIEYTSTMDIDEGVRLAIA